MKIKFAIITLMCLFSFFCKSNQLAFAYSDFYGDCVKGYEFTDSPIDAIVLSPLSRKCQERCQNECNAFSRKAYDNPDYEGSGVELNEDVITNCMTSCQNGKIFKSRYYEAKKKVNPSDKREVELKPEAKIGVACSGTKEEIANNVVRSRFSVAKGDKMKITLTGKTPDSSKIYLCGKKNIKLRPIFPNVDSSTFEIEKSDWNNDIDKQNAWSSKMYHACFAEMDDVSFKALTNKKVWESENGYTVCDWHARNPNYINTEMYIANGDELNISWVGEYSNKMINNTNATRKVLIDCLKDKNIVPNVKEKCKNAFLESSGILIKNPTQNSFDFFDDASSGILIRGEDARSGEIIGGYNGSGDSSSTEKYKILNLTGAVMDEGMETKLNEGLSGCEKDDEDAYSNPECIKIEKYGRSIYSFNGILGEFSSKRTPLAIRHNEIPFTGDLNKYKDLYKAHIGGYDLEVGWGGCPFSDGKNIQYAVFSETNETSSQYDNLPQIPESDWADLPLEVLEPDGVLDLSQISQAGKLFFRIKTIPGSAGDDPKIIDLYENPANHHGQYYITVERLEDSSSIVKNGPITTLVKAVTHIMLGKDRQIGSIINEGVIYNMYNGVASNSKFSNIVKTMLVLYMVLSGIGFGLGIVKANNQELIYRLLKLGFVLAVISPTSWNFFGGYLVPLCIDGTTELIAKIMAGSASLEGAGLLEAEIMKNPYLIFETFDAPLKIMLSAAIWKKVVALLFNGLVGIIMVIVLIAAIIIYLINIMKVIVAYLVSIIVLSILIIITPVILPFILFSTTKSIFDKWVKQIISFMLQPIMCFAAISLFNFLLIILLKIVFNFTACPNCALNISIGTIYEACWIPSYYPIFSVHTPSTTSGSGFGSLFSVVSVAFAFLIIVHGSYLFTTYMALVASTIANGSPIRTASVAGAMDNAQNFSMLAVNTLKQTASGAMNSKNKKSAKNGKPGAGPGSGPRAGPGSRVMPR